MEIEFIINLPDLPIETYLIILGFGVFFHLILSLFEVMIMRGIYTLEDTIEKSISKIHYTFECVGVLIALGLYCHQYAELENIDAMSMFFTLLIPQFIFSFILCLIKFYILVRILDKTSNS